MNSIHVKIHNLWIMKILRLFKDCKDSSACNRCSAAQSADKTTKGTGDNSHQPSTAKQPHRWSWHKANTLSTRTDMHCAAGHSLKF